MQKIFLFIISLSFITTAQAESLDYSIHQPFVTARAMGMGGAFTAVVDDYSSFYYNPAALARRKKGNIHLNLGLGASQNYVDFISDLEDVSEDDGNAETEITNFLESKYGNNYYLRLPTLGFYWSRPRWAVAFIPADLTVNMGIHKQVGPAISLNAYLDSTLAYSYARNVKWTQKGKLSVGATGKFIHRINASETVMAGSLVGDTEVFDTSSANEGLFFDVDLGFLWTPKITKKSRMSWLRYIYPTFSFVVRNLLDLDPIMKLDVVDEDSQEAGKLKRRFDLGSKWNLPNFWVFDPKLAVDIRDMGHENWNYYKGVHIGAEMEWQMFSWWKGHWSVGINQGYLTAGFGGLIGLFQLDIATWGEEVGTTDTRNEDRRWMAELSFDW